VFNGLIDTVLDFRDDVFRNIPGLLKPEDLLDDLSADPRERAFGHALSSDIEKEDLHFEVIERPFTYGGSLSDTPHASFPTRFSDGSRVGVWYGSLELLTSVYETAYHFKKRVSDMLTGISGEVVSERKVFLVHASGILVELRSKYHRFPKLLDPADYSFTNTLGAYLYDKGQRGLLIESARYHKGSNIVAFRPDILSNPRYHTSLVYRWQPGDSTVRIEKVPGKTWRMLRL
jgi:hypothetical protein